MVLDRQHGSCRSLAAVALGALLLAACGGDGGTGTTSSKHASKAKPMQDASTAGMADAAVEAGSAEDASEPVDGGGSSYVPGYIVADAGVDCGTVAAGQLPDDLACTGLYTDVANKDVAPDVHEYAPAYLLWSDGATKQRWIYLPPDTQIDNSSPDAWHFPVGTKLFKQFSWKGRRVETRMFWKAGEGRWLKTAYQWNDDESAATRFGGGDVDVGGDTYHIPSPKECDQCHKGRDDRALGFEQVLLGLPGATGMTLSELVHQDLLTDPPVQTELSIGDDGTGNAAPALAWLHVNCGVSCHNANSNADAYKTDMYLRLSADQLDGSSSADFDPIKTTVGVAARTPRWLGNDRIVPGSPENSLLYQLVSKRDPARMQDQMPPIASRVVDSDGIMALEAWIRSLPAP